MAQKQHIWILCSAGCLALLAAILVLARPGSRDHNPMKPGSYSPEDDRFLADRIVLLGSPIDDECAKITIAKLLYLEKLDPTAPVTLYINSPGGSVTASLAIADTIATLRPPVYPCAMSHCNGTALWILAVGAPGKRYVLTDCLLSIEPTTYGTLDTEKRVFLDKLNNKMATLLASHSKLTKDEVLDALNMGRQFTIQEALTAGIFDVITNATTHSR